MSKCIKGPIYLMNSISFHHPQRASPPYSKANKLCSQPENPFSVTLKI